VLRRPDPEDGRAQSLVPGRRGEALRGDLARALRDAEAALRRYLPAADAKALLRAAKRLEQLP
jgi:hypothetical protein